MKFFTSFTLLASLVSANPMDVTKSVNSVNTTNSTGPLEVRLLRGTDNTGVKISVSNRGKKALRLFKPGTILDKAAIEKVAVFSDDERLPFDGVRLRIAPQKLWTGEAFQTIKRGQTVQINFDFGQMHDLGNRSVYELLVNSGIPYAKDNTTEIAGVIPITSNTLKVKDVDAKKAALTRMAFHQSIKRTAVQSDCQGGDLDKVNLALSNCATLAQQAANATSNDTRMAEYFKDTSDEARYNVADVFNKIADECQNSTEGVAQQYCGDIYKSCSPGVLAYTVPAYSYMVNCPLYFSALPSLTTSCHGQDQATTTLHEMSHLLQIKGTLDYGVYGYDAIKTLDAIQNLNHADTYCLFANAVNLNDIC